MNKASLPLVSIVTPSYNRLGFIEGCIQSVACQDYPNIEHIVIDGDSKDGTKEFLEKTKSEGTIEFVSEPDKGMYDAINKGLRRASGEILAYLNTDDRYFPWSVSVAVDAINNGADIVFGDLCIVVEGSDSRRWYLQFYPQFNFRHYCYFGTIAQPTVFMRRELYEKIGDFGNGFKLIADCDYWLRCAEAGARFQKIDEIIALQIDHEDTLRETQQVKLKNEFNRLYEVHGEGISKPTNFEKKLRSVFLGRKSKVKFLVTHFSKATELRNGWSYFRQILNMFPRGNLMLEIKRVMMPGFLSPGGQAGMFSNIPVDAVLRATQQSLKNE